MSFWGVREVPPGRTKQEKKSWRRWLVVAGVLFIMWWILFPLTDGPMRRGYESMWMQQSRVIGLAMFQYANDHELTYPDGKSSTEVFQKLLNEGYVKDPMTFFAPLRGKVRPVAGMPLKPENVGWDVTGGVDANSDDLLPLVFMTGFKVTYAPGSGAVRLKVPELPVPSRTWGEWWDNEPPPPEAPVPGIAVMYKGNNATFIKMEHPETGTVPNFVKPEFNAQGKVYRQLGPEGVVR